MRIHPCNESASSRPTACAIVLDSAPQIAATRRRSHRHFAMRTAAGLWATASDMAAFLVELFKGYNAKSNVFSQARIRELLAEPTEGHAYGFRLMGEGDQVFITHYGGTQGCRAGMTLNLRTGDGAVYLTNSDNGSDLGTEFLTLSPASTTGLHFVRCRSSA
jgi:CubicO group peptidase (beta-lactamase class C family)